MWENSHDFHQNLGKLGNFLNFDGNHGKSPIWRNITPTYYTFLESSHRGGHFVRAKIQALFKNDFSLLS